MAYPITGSQLDSRISTGLSTQIVVKVSNMVVGAIQDLTIQHTRNVQTVTEVGTDGVIEAVPNQATVYNITTNRIIFDKLRLPEAFARGFINIKSQLIPFNIEIMDRTSGTLGVETDAKTGVTTVNSGAGIIVHTLTNCWFQQYTTTYNAGDYIIKEGATIICEDIRTTSGTTDAPLHTKGGTYDYNSREASTDAGIDYFRGTLDVDNIINITEKGFTVPTPKAE